MADPGEGSIWLRPERAGRGPAPEHTRAGIAEAAVALADAGGLAAASMRRVAEAVGAGPASLYRYVRNRAELLSLMADRVAGEIDYPDLTGDWLADALAIAHRLADAYGRHPWMLDVLADGPDLGPSTVVALERFLAALAPVEAPAHTKLEAVGLLTGLVALSSRQAAVDTDAALARARASAAYLAVAVNARDHPHLVAALTQPAPAAGGAPSLDPFDQVVTALLRGLLT